MHEIISEKSNAEKEQGGVPAKIGKIDSTS